ncbi:hypothetical protein [Plantactinospora veratri]
MRSARTRAGSRVAAPESRTQRCSAACRLASPSAVAICAQLARCSRAASTSRRSASSSPARTLQQP